MRFGKPLYKERIDVFMKESLMHSSLRQSETSTRISLNGYGMLLSCVLFMLLLAMPDFAGAVSSNFTPTSGLVGTKITVNGSGFGTATSVTFTGGASAAFVKVSAFQMQVTVPALAQTGPITITNSTG